MSQKKVRENALLSFETFCGFLDNCVSASGPAARMKHLKTFLETYLNREANDLYQVFRLLLPAVRRPSWQRGACAFGIGQLRIRLGTARRLVEGRALTTCLLPQLDRKRGNYGLQEKALSTVLVKAAGLEVSSKDAQAVIKWRAVTSATAGNFAKTVEEVTPASCAERQASSAQSARPCTVARAESAVRGYAAAHLPAPLRVPGPAGQRVA